MRQDGISRKWYRRTVRVTSKRVNNRSTNHIVKHTSNPIATAIIIDSLLFFLCIPSINRPNPGTFAVNEAKPPEDPARDDRWLERAVFVSKAWLHEKTI